jgi:hydroxymethylpyrimidine pyrophosphatase-like HAD family hydrolase
MSKKFVFDLDGTICEEKPTFEKLLAKPNTEIIQKINDLYHLGNNIMIYTARGWAEFSATEYWLKENGVKYHSLICGKPIYDIWVDDRACNVMDWK